MNDNIRPNLAGLPSVSMAEMNPVPSYCVLDTAAGIQGVDQNTSSVAIWPGAFQVDPVPVGTQVLVQVKVHKDGAWCFLWDSNATGGSPDRSFVQTWQTPPNFIRAIRIGTGVVKAFATIYSSDSQG